MWAGERAGGQASEPSAAPLPVPATHNLQLDRRPPNLHRPEPKVHADRGNEGLREGVIREPQQQAPGRMGGGGWGCGYRSACAPPKIGRGRRARARARCGPLRAAGRQTGGSHGAGRAVRCTHSGEHTACINPVVCVRHTHTHMILPSLRRVRNKNTQTRPVYASAVAETQHAFTPPTHSRFAHAAIPNQHQLGKLGKGVGRRGLVEGCARAEHPKAGHKTRFIFFGLKARKGPHNRTCE